MRFLLKYLIVLYKLRDISYLYYVTYVSHALLFEARGKKQEARDM